MRGDVLYAGKIQRIVMGDVLNMAHQRAGIALRMIKLVRGEAVINHDNRTTA